MLIPLIIPLQQAPQSRTFVPCLQSLILATLTHNDSNRHIPNLSVPVHRSPTHLCVQDSKLPLQPRHICLPALREEATRHNLVVK